VEDSRRQGLHRREPSARQRFHGCRRRARAGEDRGIKTGAETRGPGGNHSAGCELGREASQRGSRVCAIRAGCRGRLLGRAPEERRQRTLPRGRRSQRRRPPRLQREGMRGGTLPPRGARHAPTGRERHVLDSPCRRLARDGGSRRDMGDGATRVTNPAAGHSGRASVYPVPTRASAAFRSPRPVEPRSGRTTSIGSRRSST
jgi:hypothetical protein